MSHELHFSSGVIKTIKVFRFYFPLRKFVRNELGRRRKKYLRVCLETISFIPGLYSKWYKSFIHVQGLFYSIFIQGSKNFEQKNRDAGKRHKAKKKRLFFLSNFEIITSNYLTDSNSFTNYVCSEKVGLLLYSTLSTFFAVLFRSIYFATGPTRKSA